MPRDLADVLHYFLPELEESPEEAASDPAPAPVPQEPAETASPRRDTAHPPLPVLGVPIGDRDVVRAALAWNLAVETARLGASTVLLAPESDRGSPLWPEAGIGPLGCELLFCPAKDLASLYAAANEVSSRHAARARRGGIVFVRIPPEWLDTDDAPTDPVRWMLMLSATRPRDLDDTAALARALCERHAALELGVTLHGVDSIAEAREAYDVLARRSELASARPLISYGLLVDDLHVYRAIAAQRAIGLAHPQSPAARALSDVARLLYEDARSRVLG